MIGVEQGTFSPELTKEIDMLKLEVAKGSSSLRPRADSLRTCSDTQVLRSTVQNLLKSRTSSHLVSVP